MTTLATVLVTTSAFIHALWNLIGKRQNPSSAFFLIASFFAALIVLPIPFFYRSILPVFPPTLWILLAITGIFQSIYYVGLAGAYRQGDISVAYPLVRAVPVIIVTILSALLQIGKPLNAIGSAGIALVVFGCLILPLPGFHEVRLRAYLNPCCLLALVAALGTSGYTLIDNQALSVLRGLPISSSSNISPTLMFLAFETLTTTFALAIYILARQSEHLEIKITWKNKRKQAALAGVLITTTYGLVLLAMNSITNVSYVIAFRQLSIPLAALMGFTVQKEPLTTPKGVGITMVFGGLILIGVA